MNVITYQRLAILILTLALHVYNTLIRLTVTVMSIIDNDIENNNNTRQIIIIIIIRFDFSF